MARLPKWSWTVVVLMASSVGALADSVNFSTFVTGPNISAAVGGNSTIAITYAGNKFVGSVYFNNQLFSTNLTGGGVTSFGNPLPDCSACVGEVVLASSLGQGGFAIGDIFAGSGANGNVYHYSNTGGAPALFVTVPSGTLRQIFFDPGSSFGGDMLVSTDTGHIYKITSAGTVIPVASVGEDTEGLDIAGSSWGPYAGDLLVSSEGSANIRLVSPTGVITPVLIGGLSGQFPGAETVSFVPTTLDASDPLQGFYVANYASNIQFAAASNFTSQGLQGDAIITDEVGGSTAWDVHYDSGTGTFIKTPFTFPGNQISQFEDGIFVTPQRIIESGPPPSGTPEPSSLLLLATGLLGLGGTMKRKFTS